MGPGFVATPTPKSTMLQDGMELGCSRGFECTICYESPNNPVVTFCGHLFCYDCLREWVKIHSQQKKCPVCKTPLSKVVRILGQEGGHAHHFDMDDSTAEMQDDLHKDPRVEDESQDPQPSVLDSSLRAADRFANETLSIVNSTAEEHHSDTRETQMPRPYRTQSHTAQLSSSSSAVTLSPPQTSASASTSPQAAPAAGNPHTIGTAGRIVRRREGRVVRAVTRWIHERTRPLVH